MGTTDSTYAQHCTQPCPSYSCSVVHDEVHPWRGAHLGIRHYLCASHTHELPCNGIFVLRSCGDARCPLVQAEVARNQGGPLLPLMSLTGKSLIQQVQEEGLRGALFNPGTPIELCMDTGELGQIPGHADEALDETLDTSATSN